MQRQRQRIDAEVEGSAAAQCRIEEAAAGFLGMPVGQVGADAPQRPDPPRRDLLACRIDRRQEAAPQRLHGEDIALPRCLRDRIDIIAAQRDRLLDQDRLAGGDRPQRLHGMEMVRGRDVDRLDRRIGEKGSFVHIGGRAEAGGEALRLLERTRMDGDDPRLRQQAEIGGKEPGDGAGAHDPPAE